MYHGPEFEVEQPKMAEVFGMMIKNVVYVLEIDSRRNRFPFHLVMVSFLPAVDRLMSSLS